jgi:hypothetical protein
VKFLRDFEDASDAAFALSLLRSNGVAAHVVTDPRRVGYRASLYVYLDQQFEDGAALLADPGHKVENPIDVEEYDRLASSTTLGPIVRWGLIFAAFSIAFAALAAILGSSLQRAGV